MSEQLDPIPADARVFGVTVDEMATAQARAADLEHAEDTIRAALDALEHTARDLHLLHVRGSIDDCPKEACQRARKAIAELDDYHRPSEKPDDVGG